MNAVCLIFLVRDQDVFVSGRFERFLDLLEANPQFSSVLYFSNSVLGAISQNIQVRVKALLVLKQLELLAGAIFEPLLPLIPSVDAGYQLRQHAALLEQLFGVSTRGVWLHECAWEASLTSVLTSTGFEFTLLSATQLERDQGLWITEDLGKTLKIFGFENATDVPFQPKKGLQVLALEFSDSLLLLEQLFEFKTMLCAAVLDSQKPKALIYPKPSWNRSDPWRELLGTPEINWLQKRIARASLKLNAQFRVPDQAFQFLYQAQAASILEHPELHGLAYQNIIQAENILEPHKYAWLEIEQTDFDCDGSDEIIAEAHTMNLYFKPENGGQLLEFDDRNRHLNLVVSALSDHFIGAEESLYRFENDLTLELGDFLGNSYEASKYRDRVTMTRSGFVRGPAGVPVLVEVKKAVRILPKESKLEVSYRFTNYGDWDIVTRFGSAWELTLFDPNAQIVINKVKTVPISSTLEHHKTQSIGLRQISANLEFQILFGRENLVWSLQKSDSILILPLWDLDLPKGRSRRIQYEVKLLDS